MDLEGGVTFRWRYGFFGKLLLRPGWLFWGTEIVLLDNGDC